MRNLYTYRQLISIKWEREENHIFKASGYLFVSAPFKTCILHLWTQNRKDGRSISPYHLLINSSLTIRSIRACSYDKKTTHFIFKQQGTCIWYCFKKEMHVVIQYSQFFFYFQTPWLIGPMPMDWLAKSRERWEKSQNFNLLLKNTVLSQISR